MEYYGRGDVALAQFLASVWPAAGQKCAYPPDSPHAPGCGDGAPAHVRTYAHGGGLLTITVGRLPLNQALPGGEAGQLWFWARPRGVRPALARPLPSPVQTGGCSSIRRCPAAAPASFCRGRAGRAHRICIQSCQCQVAALVSCTADRSIGDRSYKPH